MPDIAADLPAGLTSRPPTTDDVEAVVALLRADEDRATGDPHTTVGDIASDWARPSVSLATDHVLVLDGDRLVGYADQSAGRAWVGVHPDDHGRGIGGWLLRWTESHARAAGLDVVGQTIGDAHTAAVDLLGSAGYTRRWDTWVFQIPLGDDLPAPRLPDGHAIRPLRRPGEDAAAHAVVETAFSAWPGRLGVSFEDWRAGHLDRDDVHVLTAVDPDDTPVGVAVCLDEGEGEGWVEQLAVDGGQRGRGLGAALLHTAFRHFRDRGCTTAGLSTDSRTGARALYERVGMRVTGSYARWAIDLSG